MGEFAIGQSVSRFEDPRLLRGGGRYVDDIVLPGMAFGHVLRSPHAHARIRSIETGQGQGRARRAGGADRRGLDRVRLGRPAGARRPQAPRRLAQLPAALSGAGQGSRALGRRLRRLRGGRDQAPGRRRRRTDRGRLRAAAGRDRHRRRRQAGRAAGLGRLQGQHLLRADSRRQGRDRRGLRQGRARGQAAPRDQPRHHRIDGAARLDRRLQPSRRPLHDLHHAAARASLPLRTRQATCSRCPSTRCAWSPATSAAASA